MRIAVTGRTGQVVSSLIDRGALSGHDVVAVGRPALDLLDPGGVAAALAAARPDLIVSAAAYTAVDKAETEPETAEAINGRGAGAIAAAAATLGVPLVHLSTDYVFDGTSPVPYVETDRPAPLGAYGAGKLAGEREVASATTDYVILRVAWVYSPFGQNFLRTMLRLGETRPELGVVHDQHGGPTSALDLADAIVAIAERLTEDPSAELRGIFHLPPAGEATWAEFAEAIFDGARQRGRPPVRVLRITTSEYPTPARRPMNSRLSGDKIARVYGISLPDWRRSTNDCLDRLLGQISQAAE